MRVISAKPIPWYRRRWFKIVVAFVIVCIVASAVSAVGVFRVWQSSPEKALLDATNYAVATPATYKITSSDTDLSVSVKDQHYWATGTLNNIPLSVVYRDNTLYFKSPQPDKLYDAYFANAIPASFANTIKSTLAGLKDRWISLDLYKLPMSQGGSGAARCGIEAITQLTSADSAKVNLGSLYVANPFLSTKTLESSLIQTVYQLHFDRTHFKNFYNNLTKSNGYQSSESCSSANNPLANTELLDKAATVTVTKSDHHLRTISILGDSDTTTKIVADYTKVPTIPVPTDVTTYDQITNMLLKTFMPSLFGTQ